MRQIKFKAKRLDNGEWVEGDLLQHLDGTTLIGDNQGEFIDDGYGHCDYHKVYEVNPSTVCQFTGLKDKEGKEVWEHDIIVGKPIGTNVAEVRYNRGHYGLFGINSETEFINLSNVDLLENNKLNHFKVIDSIFNYEK